MESTQDATFSDDGYHLWKWGNLHIYEICKILTFLFSGIDINGQHNWIAREILTGNDILLVKISLLELKVSLSKCVPN